LAHHYKVDKNFNTNRSGCFWLDNQFVKDDSLELYVFLHFLAHFRKLQFPGMKTLQNKGNWI